jgi:hypothetical protein
MSFQDDYSGNPSFEKQNMKLKFHIIAPLLLMAYCVLACSSQSDLTTITSTEASQIPVAPMTPSPTPPSPRNFFTKTPQPSPLSTFTVTIPTSSIVDGWLVYKNPIYNYEFSYPPGTTLKISSVESFPGELPAGVTFDEYLLQLQDKYGDLCVIATYGEGFLLVQAPNGWDYVLCGGFGVGNEPIVEKSEQVFINNKVYTARGWALYRKEGDKIILESEFFFVDLEDSTHFAYGSNLERAPDKFENYLAVKETLLQMLASYRTVR